MLDKVLNFIFSTKLTAVLLFIFAFAIGRATFWEAEYDTTAAKVAVYNAKWFEYVILLLLMNLIGNIVKYKMFRKEKFTVLIFHLSFIIIILGAGITRYTGFEGMMKIREGKSSNVIISDEVYLNIMVDNTDKQRPFAIRVMPNEFLPGYFEDDYTFLENDFTLNYKGFVKNSIDTLVESEGTPRILEIVTTGHNGRQSIYIEEGTTEYVGNIPVSFMDQRNFSQAVKLFYTDSGMVANSPYDIHYMTMQSRTEGDLLTDTIQGFPQGRLYSIGETQMVYKDLHQNKKVIQKSAPKENKNGIDMMLVDITCGGETKELKLFGGRGIVTNKVYFALNGLNFTASYGSIERPLPFEISLKDFRLERNPGTDNPSSFESDVTLLDERDGTIIDKTIFMNNVMDYDGYRFFQSSYDPDEMGTVLSVNHDFWGTWITYLGYFLMMLGFILTLMHKKTRFFALRKKLEKLRKQAGVIVVLIGVMTLSSFSGLNAQEPSHTSSNPKEVAQTHASKFSRILIQNKDGRTVPMHTTSYEFLRKVSRRSKLNGLTPEQVVLSMLSDPIGWQDVPLVHIGMDAKDLRDSLGAEDKLVAFKKFFKEDGSFIFGSQFEEIFRKEEKLRSKYEKEIMKITERVNLCVETFNDGRLRMFPVKDDPNNKWYRPIELIENVSVQNSDLLFNSFRWYKESLVDAIDNKDYSTVDSVLTQLQTIQKINGGDLVLSESQIELEIRYNKLEISNKLMKVYSLLGVILLILLVAQIILEVKSKVLDRIVKFMTYMLIISTLMHGASLGARWYISGHAPWSNAYEALVWIAFVTMLAGFIFSKNSKMTLAATALLAGLTLFVSSLGLMDPDIGFLVPVLKSYWLMIHVAIITGSYAFLGLGAILGIINLVLYLFRTQENGNRITNAISELTVNSELAITVGLFMAATGTFLGGIWANESWGRYWGWDSKETWALVIVLVYSMILHFRLIPKINDKFTFNVASVLAYGTVLMTFFGVNYYLSGLHSYAGGSGDTPEMPVWIVPTIAGLVVLMIGAGLRLKSYNNKKKFLRQEKLIAED